MCIIITHFTLNFKKIFAKLYAGINNIPFYPYIYFIDATFATHAREKSARLTTLPRSSLETVAVFRYSLSVLQIYSIRDVHYRFSVLAVNIGTPVASILKIYVRSKTHQNKMCCNLSVSSV